MDSVKMILMLIIFAMTVRGEIINCAAVKCIGVIDCANPVQPNGQTQCCAFCPNQKGKSCTYTVGTKDITIKDGKSKKVDCDNTCSCTNGILACTQKACVNP
ncbi:uncharacterized protein LOC123560556 [Mercenaria mercenaria]|uniref:uncharacterized protein LOC123560556 n=1 Tax=Mercenaria mercenaria TaxID=6596 RepID=UPI001E1D976C|nr:uncharacterized protein LOC123560556 [Mercenaria mercenaria]XP_045208663.1 uncharacterized protein LOC123560556 [Mercenaria mercenaria]XP_045208664.1 uncharacterized protein LOC123560556 [Mercenaria mercenaria]